MACGMVPIADGTDTGGSLRNPAAFCNVVGLRPSPGRVPNAGRLRSPDAAPGVRRVDVSFAPAVEAPRPEWFLDGTEPLAGATLPTHRAGIITPVAGTRMALDPDIPAAQPRVWFDAPAGGGGAGTGASGAVRSESGTYRGGWNSCWRGWAGIPAPVGGPLGLPGPPGPPDPPRVDGP